MKTYCYFLAILLLISPGTFACSDKVISVPLHFDQNFPAPNVLSWIYVNINSNNFPMLVDTGWVETDIALFPAALKTIKVKYINKKVFTAAISGIRCEGTFIIPKIKIGGAELTNVTGTLAMIDSEKECKEKLSTTSPLQGFVGLSLLKRFNILLDYKNKQLMFYPHYSYPKSLTQNWLKIPFQINNAIDTVANIDGIRARLTWDTGAAPSFVRAIPAFKTHLTSCPTSYKTFGENLRCYQPINITIDNKKIPNFLLAYNLENISKAAPRDGFVGANFYYSHVIFFDFKNNLMFIKL